MRETVLAGWGNHPRLKCRVQSARRRHDVVGFLQPNSSARGLIARGLGRSYGDAALNERGLVLDCTGLDRYLDFDDATGALTCEAGTSLKQIIEDFGPRGWFPAITPGTKFVTVGGCIANDVHGKAHHVDGCFSRCVERMEILLGDGEIVGTSRQERPDLFWATFGGMGLLGIVLTATLRLRRVETTYFRQRAIRVKNLDDLLAALDTYDAQFPYSVGWVDSLATGRNLGRGVLTVGDHAKLDDLSARQRTAPLRTTSPSPVVLPFEMPSGALNSLTVRLLNGVLETMQARGAAIAHYEKFFYPLDFVGEWNRGYGPRGFTQYQFVIPLQGGPQRIREILERITTSGQAPFLNVLKKFGKERGGLFGSDDSGEGNGLLSFPFEGYTFAIDFPVREGLEELLRDLDRRVLEAGGRVYLGKDAFLDAQTFRRMYPQLDTWLEAKQRWDPQQVFASALSRRVGLTA